MKEISRQPDHVASQKYDVIIIGGGIHGAMLLLEASRHGLRALLLERNDFGSGVSYNSLRIIHGGLRYLQSLDLVRLRESVAERKWFLQAFPDLVKPLPCLMPLYNHGLKRPAILRAALWMNDMLTSSRNDDMADVLAIGDGRILDPEETRLIFPGVDTGSLSGAALWYDAHMPDSQRVIMETLRWSCSLGGQALNYVEVSGLLEQGGKVVGVKAIDNAAGMQYEFQGSTVINAAGRDSRELAAIWDEDIPELFQPSCAWNILFDRPAPSTHALALTPDRPGGQTYFLHPWKGRLLAGTGHASYKRDIAPPMPKEKQVREFIKDINNVLPGPPLSINDIVRIYAGFLPVTSDGGTRLTKRPIIHDHGRHGGPRGLFSVTGIKFTTARKVAEQTLGILDNRLSGSGVAIPGPDTRPSAANSMTCLEYDWLPGPGETAWKSELANLIRDESVLHLDDLVLRRTGIGDNPERVHKLAHEIASLFDWDDSRRISEIDRLLGDVTIRPFTVRR